MIRLTWAGATVGAILSLNIALAACGQREVPRALSHVEAAPPPAGPPCIHEVCVERPARLKCIPSSAPYCNEYEIIYQHHCVCDRWATYAPEQDGGGEPCR